MLVYHLASHKNACELHVFNFFHLPKGQTLLALETIVLSLPRPATTTKYLSSWQLLALNGGGWLKGVAKVLVLRIFSARVNKA